MQAIPKCLNCKVEMKPGRIMDNGNYNPAHWVPEENSSDNLLDSVKSLFIERGSLRINAYNCSKCGLVQLYTKESER